MISGSVVLMQGVNELVQIPGIGYVFTETLLRIVTNSFSELYERRNS